MDMIKTRQIILDTETTGINKNGCHYEGHQIIEIGAVELINRRLTKSNFHVYIKPDRLVTPEAYSIHGISNEFLLDKPNFSKIANKLLEFISGSELIIHNAPFDIGFLNYELRNLNRYAPTIEECCQITDSLVIARQLFPGKRNSLDALCNRYEIDNTKRKLHGALLDSKILAEVYLRMTGGQTSLNFSIELEEKMPSINGELQKIVRTSQRLKVVRANKQELSKHDHCLDLLKGSRCLWRD
ncbi:DNA polymerase III subunit epsilon [Candidatus Profftia tarda]|uniref:DNA polymerase III subunit epsilon n=1 Tax=Candidatus Profftia tarda TaxID=1177216 RepID=UPI001C1FE5D9|nr:DNA polymerase III subunit epsilon [Candidatus Profftia tarda]